MKLRHQITQLLRTASFSVNTVGLRCCQLRYTENWYGYISRICRKMAPSNIILISDQKEISGDLTSKYRIDNPINERIVVLDYIYDTIKKELIGYHHIADNDILELIATCLKVGESISISFENYMTCIFTGKFKMIRRYHKT